VAVVGTDSELTRLSGELAQQEWHGNAIRIELGKMSSPEQIFLAFDGRPDCALAIVLGPSVESLSMKQFSTLIGTHLGCVPVYTWEGFHEAHLKKVSLDSVTPDWIFQSGFRLGSKTVHEALKRTFDVIASLLLAVAGLLPMICIAAYVRLASPGPVLFFQERRGRFGKTFNLVKFRTMSVGSSGGTTTLGDKRIIPGGGFLRRYRLDELPQIYNILRGDMSLIGPRPEWIRCAERYSQEIDLYDLRHLVRPGLTGWAQVNYPYGQDVNDARAKLSYDLFYIRNFSLLLDFVIVVKTAYVTIFGRGGR
jgi:lipopolysaccharide/colanic/teichoic acid biosynthesis glycosyltransferase